MRYKFLLAASLLLAALACTREPDFYNAELTVPEAGIDESGLVLDGKAEKAHISLASNMWWKARVVYSDDSSENWCILTPDHGYGDVEIDVTSTRNYQLNQSRTATIVIEGDDANTPFRKEFTIVQQASGLYVELPGLESPVLDVPIVSNTNLVDVKSNSDWEVVSDQDWCQVSGTGLRGDGEVTVVCSLNASKAKRTARVKVISKADASVKAEFDVLQNDEFPATTLTVTKTPEEFKAAWDPIVGTFRYEINVKKVDGSTAVIDAGQATGFDLLAAPLFAVPEYAGFVELSVTAYTDDPEVFSVSNTVESNSHFTGGKGTPDAPFILGDERSLQNVTVANPVLAGACYRLEITPDMKTFVPLCNTSSPFAGVFDGNGKVISSWKPVVLCDETNNFGFFRAVASGAVVKNLKFSGCDFSLTINEGGKVSGTDNGIGFVAGLNGGEISEIEVSGCHIATEAGTSPLTVGGIAGQNSGTIRNCSLSGGRISAAEDRNKSDEFNVGGVSGYNTDTGVISACTNGNEIIAMTIVGGIAGYNDGKVLTCLNSGKITANYYFGGITGYVKTTGKGTCLIKDCCNSGTLVMDEPAGFGRGAAYVGGITSRIHSTGTAVENCCNLGEMIIGTSVSSSNMRIGGLVGHINNTGKLLNSYADCQVTIAGKVNYGGLVGEFADKATTVKNCYSVAKLTKTDSASGLFGDALGKCAKSAVVQSCYALKNGGDVFAGGTTTNVGSECGYRTEAELKAADTFAGWDFQNVWVLDGGYPHLRTVAGK